MKALPLKTPYHYLAAWLGAVKCRYPSRKLFVIGITGTKGKSTTIELLNAILEASGRKTALLSSLRMKVGQGSVPNTWSNTMPGRAKLQAFLKDAADAGCSHALIEVTSEGVRQKRHRFIDWDAAVFLNIHPEHIESHGSFEKYREAKLDFFRSLQRSRKKERFLFINTDDPNAVYFEEIAALVPRSTLVPFTAADAWKLVEALREGYDADWMHADFNVANVAAALAVARTLGIGRTTIVEALGGFRGIPGRMEFVQREPFAIVIDYAHTPHSLEELYRNLRENYGFKEGHNLIVVLGSAGGGRDTWKRSEFGKIAASYADFIVLTSEDPYNEDPFRIISEIRAGFADAPVNPKAIYEIADRREAIQKALSLAGEGDVVVLTGMGSQEFFYGPNGTKIPWGERKIVEELLKH